MGAGGQRDCHRACGPGRKALAVTDLRGPHPSSPSEGVLSGDSLDVYLNDSVYWGKVPIEAWDYSIGGFPVLRKWLSYRDVRVLGRSLSVAEARGFGDLVRRITALLLLGPDLDASYANVRGTAIEWSQFRPNHE